MIIMWLRNHITQHTGIPAQSGTLCSSYCGAITRTKEKYCETSKLTQNIQWKTDQTERSWLERNLPV